MLNVRQSQTTTGDIGISNPTAMMGLSKYCKVCGRPMYYQNTTQDGKPNQRMEEEVEYGVHAECLSKYYESIGHVINSDVENEMKRQIEADKEKIAAVDLEAYAENFKGRPAQ